MDEFCAKEFFYINATMLMALSVTYKHIVFVPLQSEVAETHVLAQIMDIHVCLLLRNFSWNVLAVQTTARNNRASAARQRRYKQASLTKEDGVFSGVRAEELS
jgi:hypothetical protein